MDDLMRKECGLPRRGTLASIELGFRKVLAEEVDAGARREDVQREVALHWLRQQRPSGFLARVLYAWRVFRVVLAGGR